MEFIVYILHLCYWYRIEIQTSVSYDIITIIATFASIANLMRSYNYPDWYTPFTARTHCYSGAS